MDIEDGVLDVPRHGLQIHKTFIPIHQAESSACSWHWGKGLRNTDGLGSKPSGLGIIVRPIHYAVLIAVCLAALWILWYNSIFHVFWQFGHLEQRAKKRITGTQLQAWALNLLEQYATTVTNDTPDVSDLGTNFPRQLLGLYHRPPHIKINQYTNVPPYVFVMWGGGMIGHCGFEIGATNFIGRGHAWQPGVYFWRD